MIKIVIVDYGSSNIHSVLAACRAVATKQHQVLVSDKAETIAQADKIIFPGQGAIKQCSIQLHKKELMEVLRTCIQSKPFLGICLGMQFLMEYSSENGGVDSLGILSGDVKRFEPNQQTENGIKYKIPMIGWNLVHQTKPHPLWHGISDHSYFYFTHSYYVETKNKTDVASITNYIHPYTSAIAKGQLFATQFHPEKSQDNGLRLFENFLSWDGAPDTV